MNYIGVALVFRELNVKFKKWLSTWYYRNGFSTVKPNKVKMALFLHHR